MQLISFTKGTENARYVNKVICTDDSYIHKQVEVRNGLLYMRMKKRSLTQ